MQVGPGFGPGFGSGFGFGAGKPGGAVPPPYEPVTHVPWDLPCAACGASLRGNAVASTCGACGAGVEQSLQRWWMRYRPLEVRQQLIAGMRLIAYGSWVSLGVWALFVLLFALGAIGLELKNFIIVLVTAIVPFLAVLVGIWVMTRREEDGKIHAHIAPLRTSLRLIVVTYAVGAVLMVVAFAGISLYVDKVIKSIDASMQSAETLTKSTSRVPPPSMSSKPPFDTSSVLTSIAGNSKIKLVDLGVGLPGAVLFGLIAWFASRTAIRMPSAVLATQGKALAAGCVAVNLVVPFAGGFVSMIILPAYLLRVASRLEMGEMQS